MEKIIASAIKFCPKDSEYPQIVCGKRHCDCYEWMQKHKVEYDKPTQEQGFLTNNSTFLDRYEAAEVAWYANQVLKESNTYQKMWADYIENGELTKAYMLFSEDLW